MGRSASPERDGAARPAARDRAAGGRGATGQGRGGVPGNGSSLGWHRLLGQIAGANQREHIERALRTYVATWATGDVEGRLALFADDVVVEDPATRRQATGKAELREVLASGIPSDWDLVFSFERVAVVADEAILTYRVTLRAGDAAPAELLVNAHAEFGPDGLIHRYRTFFDADSITDHPKS